MPLTLPLQKIARSIALMLDDTPMIQSFGPFYGEKKYINLGSNHRRKSKNHDMTSKIDGCLKRINHLIYNLLLTFLVFTYTYFLTSYWL